MEPEPIIGMKDRFEGELGVLDHRFPLHLFLLPDNETQGTLETLLLAGAEQQYPDLLKSACDYIDTVRPNYSKNLKGFNDTKATVGVIANVLRPGRANQVSIGNDEWLTTNSLRDIPSHNKLSVFLESLCTLLEATPPTTDI